MTVALTSDTCASWLIINLEIIKQHTYVWTNRGNQTKNETAGKMHRQKTQEACSETEQISVEEDRLV